jgi:hypothetical protein
LKIFKIFLFLIFVFSLFFNNLFSYVKTNDLTEKNIDSSVYRSVLYPGLGQYYIGKKTKGVTFISLTTLLIAGSVYSYNEARNKYDNYSSLGYHDDNLYNEYSDKIDQMYVFVSLLAVVWGYNIYDVYKDSKKIIKKDGFNVSLEDNKAMILYSKIY